MAKGIPNSAAVQYKVHLKPTDVGLLVMKRMERPHLDKSAELRRFIELGYAAEQAGFILDGTVLRHAGRMWDTQPDFVGQAQNLAAPAAGKPAAATPEAGVSHSRSGGKGSTGAGEAEANTVPEGESTSVTNETAPSLRKRLRGISG